MNKTDANRRVLAIQAKKKRHKPSKRKGRGSGGGGGGTGAGAAPERQQQAQGDSEQMQQQLLNKQPSKQGLTVFSRTSLDSSSKYPQSDRQYSGGNGNRLVRGGFKDFTDRILDKYKKVINSAPV
ncbi:uncharacterized protein LOC111643166 [Copidosoma floridanum]|uniref:uncharacterized protein LOC111643166 n=1 Tax=Copidosoma floridanum TaxID=29053 RepID=UPI000C6FB8FA|nr:uncharacterized protein LOC111643166 [Copidosoma floridanum]